MMSRSRRVETSRGARPRVLLAAALAACSLLASGGAGAATVAECSGTATPSASPARSGCSATFTVPAAGRFTLQLAPGDSYSGRLRACVIRAGGVVVMCDAGTFVGGAARLPLNPDDPLQSPSQPARVSAALTPGTYTLSVSGAYHARQSIGGPVGPLLPAVCVPVVHLCLPYIPIVVPLPHVVDADVDAGVGPYGASVVEG